MADETNTCNSRTYEAGDDLRERIVSALHVLNGGLSLQRAEESIMMLTRERNELGDEVKLLRTKLSDEQAENARLAAVNETLENTIKAMTGNLNWIVESNAQAVRERDDYKAKLTEALAEVSRLARGHVEAVEAGRNFLGYAHTNRWGHGVDSEGGYACIDPVSRLVPSIKEANERAQRVASAPWDIVAVYKVM